MAAAKAPLLSGEPPSHVVVIPQDKSKDGKASGSPGKDSKQAGDQLPPPEPSAEPTLPPPTLFNKPPKQPGIWLERLVLDVYEFRGLAELGLLVLFFLISSFFLYAQWGSSTAAFKNSVVTSFRGWDAGNDWEANTLAGVETFSDGYQYMTGYLNNIIGRTSALNISRDPNVVYIGENAAVRYARIAVKLDTGCKLRKFDPGLSRYNTTNNPACFRDALDFAIKARNSQNDEDPTAYLKFLPYADDDIITFLQPNETMRRTRPVLARWSLLGGCDGELPWQQRTCLPNSANTRRKGWFATEVISPLFTREQMRIKLGNESLTQPADEGVISKYGTAMHMAVLAEDRNGKDVSIFSVTISLRGKARLLTTRTATLSLNHLSLLQKTPLPFTVLQILFLAFTLFYIWVELRKWRLCWLQHQSMLLYFRYWWNWAQIVSHFLNFLWVFWSWSLKNEKLLWPVDMVQFNELERKARTYTGYLYFGIAVNLVLGINLCRWMRVHLGLHAFYQVFVDAGRSLLDFGVFVLYIILVLGSATFAFFQISGGNGDFVLFSNGLSAMARLPFQFLGFDEFYNDGLGVGDYSWTVTGLFWLTLIFLFLFVQNTLLAIFNLAYMNARKKSLKVEMSFIYWVLHRIFFNIWYCAYRFLQFFAAVGAAARRPRARSGSDDEGSELSTYDYEYAGTMYFGRVWRIFRDARISGVGSYPAPHMYLMRKYAKTGDSVSNHPRRLMWCRWCIACISEMQAVAAMYTDYATLKLQTGHHLETDVRPTWIALGGFDRLVAKKQFGAVRRTVTRHTGKSLDQQMEYNRFVSSVPAWTQQVTAEELEQFFLFMAAGRSRLRLNNRSRMGFLVQLIFGPTPFDALAALEAKLDSWDSDSDSDEDEDAAQKPADHEAAPKTRFGRPVAEAKEDDDDEDDDDDKPETPRAMHAARLRSLIQAIMVVYLNASKPIRDADGDGVDDMEDDPSELIRKFKKDFRESTKETQDALAARLQQQDMMMMQMMAQLTALHHELSRLKQKRGRSSSRHGGASEDRGRPDDGSSRGPDPAAGRQRGDRSSTPAMDNRPATRFVHRT